MVLAASIAVVLVGVSASSVRTTQAATQGRWVIRDLGTLGGSESRAGAINDRGQVVGWADTKSGDAHAFLWQAGRMHDLGALDVYRTTEFAVVAVREPPPLGINNRGQVVGSAETTAKDKRGEPVSHAFLWQNGKMRDLGTLGGPESWATAINDRGQVVGGSETTATNKRGRPVSHAFLWQNGKMRDLGTLGGMSSFASSINNRGQVVGWADTRTANRDHAFLWQNGRMRDLGTLGGTKSRGYGINNRGQVVGFSGYGGRTAYPHAVLWKGRTASDLGTRRGTETSYAYDINDRGEIVGESYNVGSWRSSRYAVLWREGTLIDLPSLGVPQPEETTPAAFGINKLGQIVGSSHTKSGETHAVLWTYKP
jgi:probable HAF family extracellular repeat protein